MLYSMKRLFACQASFTSRIIARLSAVESRPAQRPLESARSHEIFMAGRIPQSFIDELTARADIVELIGSRVELKKAGREYRACCPFHNEKTPSFWVSPQKQFYHCFGCGAHGSALGFLMEYDKLSFPEAIEELAGRLGLNVPREAGGSPT